MQGRCKSWCNGIKDFLVVMYSGGNRCGESGKVRQGDTEECGEQVNEGGIEQKRGRKGQCMRIHRNGLVM